MKAMLKAPRSKLLNPILDELLSTFAFKSHVRRYNVGGARAQHEVIHHIECTGGRGGGRGQGC